MCRKLSPQQSHQPERHLPTAYPSPDPNLRGGAAPHQILETFLWGKVGRDKDKHGSLALITWLGLKSAGTGEPVQGSIVPVVHMCRIGCPPCRSIWSWKLPWPTNLGDLPSREKGGLSNAKLSCGRSMYPSKSFSPSQAGEPLLPEKRHHLWPWSILKLQKRGNSLARGQMRASGGQPT